MMVWEKKKTPSNHENAKHFGLQRKEIMNDNNKKNSFFDLIKLATVIGIFSGGYTIGQGQASSLVDYLKEQKVELQKENEILTSQVSNLKRELSIQTSKATSSQSKDIAVVIDSVASEKATAGSISAEMSDSAEISEPAYTEAVIQTENSERLFDGDLVISVAGMKFEKSPLRYTVYGSIGGLGEKNIELRGESPGHVTIFKDFEVRLLSTSTFSSKFGITRINEK